MEVTETHVILTKEEFARILNEIAELKSHIKELESQLNKNSGNSSKPPSSDGYKKKVKNNRTKSGKRPGAQEWQESAPTYSDSYPSYEKCCGFHPRI